MTGRVDFRRSMAAAPPFAGLATLAADHEAAALVADTSSPEARELLELLDPATRARVLAVQARRGQPREIAQVLYRSLLVIGLSWGVAWLHLLRTDASAGDWQGAALAAALRRRLDDAAQAVESRLKSQGADPLPSAASVWHDAIKPAMQGVHDADAPEAAGQFTAAARAHARPLVLRACVQACAALAALVEIEEEPGPAADAEPSTSAPQERGFQWPSLS